MKPYLKYCLFASLTFGVMSCTDSEVVTNNYNEASRLLISLSAEIDQLNVTRADDSGFANGDRIGLYAVCRDDQSNPGSITDENKLADNVGFTFDESGYSWIGDRNLYYPDNNTQVDFFSYYPYASKLDKPDSFSFSVQKNQSGDATSGSLSPYEKSDFLWGAAKSITAQDDKVNITFSHVLSSVKVTLTKGDGFENDEWIALDKSVMVMNTGLDCQINLETGVTTLPDLPTVQPIVMSVCDDSYRAIVIPQTIMADKPLLSINVGGESYSFVKSEQLTYVASKMHNFTITVSKKSDNGDFEFEVTSESVTPWESDPISHNGKLREYVIVNVPTAGGLEESVRMAKIDPSELINLKVTGEMTNEDFFFLREKCKNLEALNIREVTLRHCTAERYGSEDFEDFTIPREACCDMEVLSTVVFPEKLKRIGELAFINTGLTGSLILPEGLEYIGGAAFEAGKNSSLTGNLSLPSTLKTIGGTAFSGCDFSGELILPEGLEYIGESAFSECKYFTGEIHIPSSLKELGGRAFSRMEGITGHIDIPRNQTVIHSLDMPGITSVRLPDAPVKIETEAFWNVPLRGTLVIPESVEVIEATAFAGTKLSHIVFPPNLEYIEASLCYGNKFLQDTIKIPSKVKAIKSRAFYNCEKLDAVILPASLEKIESDAFFGCRSLTYIRCEAKEPPILSEDAFNSIAKDNFTIEVPEESVNAYRLAPAWREFKRISAYKNFVARPSKYNVLNKGGKIEIILNADEEWELVEEGMPNWCHVNHSSGSMKTIIELSVDEMSHGSQNRSGEVTFRLKNDKETLTHINVGQYDYEYDEDQCLKLQTKEKGNGIDLFFCGDGYDAIDISNGTYLEDMKHEMEYFFGVEPYASYRDYFNVYTSFALSEDSGVEDVDHWRRTKFHTAIMNNDERFRSDWMGALNYCAETANEIISKDHPRVGCILLVNSPSYEGVTYIGESFCSVVTKSELPYPNDARGILQHEAGGHGIGWLGDEYQYHASHIDKCNCTDCGHSDALRGDHSWGYALNLSLSGRYKDVPWYHLMKHSDYYDIVDVYEGGYFHKKGVYRSEQNSCMNNNVPYFSTWSRQLIVKRILDWAGEDFSLEKFYANDNREYGIDFTRSSSIKTLDSYLPAIQGNAPVRITNYKFGKKGGKK